MDYEKMAKRVASGGEHNGFYVRWDDPGYGDDHTRADLDLMKAFLGDGPIFEGGSPDFEGHFFNNAPDVGPAVTTVRGGRTFHDEELLSEIADSLGAEPVKMTEHATWDDLAKALQLFDGSQDEDEGEWDDDGGWD